MHLLDTELVWALRHAKAGTADPAVAAWAASQPRTALFISALTLGELATALLQLERADKSAAGMLRRWAEEAVPAAFDGRVLPVDAAVARRAAALGYAEPRDALLAATALEHGLTLATPHPAHYRPGKVRTVNPWRYVAGAPDEELDWREAARGGPFWLRNLFARG
ncbi:PIN domain-containing protein [Sphingomonas sp. DT-51]|uniref:PIN domain-containing protein n=1 Tax=Sphingomonas sp. DT-51 TaxID=3396165 RepID=UPI003F1DDFEC